MQGQHFQRWFSLWAASVDDLFAGEMATQAKRRAAIIAETMQYRLGIDSPQEGFSAAYRAALGLTPDA
jgi:hemoglobin